jgi:uncharacterized protein (TIGR00255 family)
MIKSMTGFANGVLKIDSELSYAIELRSVNNRYFDFNLRMEDDLKYLETKIKALLNVKIKRGKIDCRIIKSISSNTENKYSKDEVKKAVSIMRAISKISHQDFKVTPMEIINFIHFNQSQATIKFDEKKFMSILKTIITKFDHDREREGKNLSLILKANVNAINKKIISIRKFYKIDSKEYQFKLKEKITTVLKDVDHQRLHQEAVLFLQKSDIEEELNRILSHNQEIIQLLNSNEPVGKKLDFMMQELNREANTLGSKSISARISGLAVDIKVLIEQMREQIQNIE